MKLRQPQLLPLLLLLLGAACVVRLGEAAVHAETSAVHAEQPIGPETGRVEENLLESAADDPEEERDYIEAMEMLENEATANGLSAEEVQQKWRRFRVPRIRLPRIRFPRIRLPRIRLPRIRLPRFRLPRLRLRLPKIRVRLNLRKLGKHLNVFRHIRKFRDMIKSLINKPDEDSMLKPHVMRLAMAMTEMIANFETSSKQIIEAQQMVRELASNYKTLRNAAPM